MRRNSLHQYYRVIWFLLLAGIGTSCVTQREIVVDLFQPPVIHLPDSLKKVVVLHRVSADDRDYLEQNKSVSERTEEEGIRVMAGERAVFGFLDNMVNEDRFTPTGNIRWLDTLVLHQDSFPAPLSWEVVEKFCRDNDADILISLESVTYHSDIKYSTYERRTHESRNKIWSKTMLYNVQNQMMQKASYTFTVSSGWRVYDPQKEEILLQRSVTDSITYEADGINKEEVEKKLPSKQSIAERTGFLVGEGFARIILPSYKTVQRSYYGGGNKTLREATNAVKFRDWDSASAFWQTLLKTARPALQARLLYNLALVAEMEGRPLDALSALAKAERIYHEGDQEKYRRQIITTWNLNKEML